MTYKLTVVITDDCDPEPVPLEEIIHMVECSVDLAGLDAKVEHSELIAE